MWRQSLTSSRSIRENAEAGETRLRLLFLFFVLLAGLIVYRLVILMVFNHDFYQALSSGSREVYNNLFPKRGQVYIQDSRTGEEYPLALNRDYFLLFADTRKITNQEQAEDTAEKLAGVLGYDEEKKFMVFLQLSKLTDPYEPIEQKLTEEQMEVVKALGLPGLGFSRLPARYYPEGRLGAAIIGFLGKDEEGNNVGRYGIEGYWNKELSGSGGFVEGAQAAVGGWIPLASWSFQPATPGADILLTIDRTLEYKACEILEQARQEYGAESASLVLMDPNTGAIRAMCSQPDFDPNDYAAVKDANVYNNSAIFTAYEPGSVFKPLIMSAALNEGVVTPDTWFTDPGERNDICSSRIRNAEGKTYGAQTMSGILENSINTGMVFVAEKLGKPKMQEYIGNFGFGLKTGLELDTEVAGNISSLFVNKSDKLDCYTATASFGQGLTVTPLQMAVAISSIANGGKLLRPYIVAEVRYPDGRQEKTKAKEVKRVLDSRQALLAAGMMVNVIDRGQSKGAALAGYYLGGKTGTAQIPGPGGYIEDTNHTFVGLGPIDSPQFVLVIKFSRPQRKYADSTAVPTFRKIAQFVLQYYHIPPTR